MKNVIALRPYIVPYYLYMIEEQKRLFKDKVRTVRVVANDEWEAQRIACEEIQKMQGNLGTPYIKVKGSPRLPVCDVLIFHALALPNKVCNYGCCTAKGSSR